MLELELGFGLGLGLGLGSGAYLLPTDSLPLIQRSAARVPYARGKRVTTAITWG